MTTPRFGAIVGLVIGIVGVSFGFPEAVTVAALAAIGFVIGLFIDGRLDADFIRGPGRKLD